MSYSQHKHVPKADGAPARRIEVFTGAGRRRNWTADEKAAIAAESFEEGARACQVRRSRTNACPSEPESCKVRLTIRPATEGIQLTNELSHSISLPIGLMRYVALLMRCERTQSVWQSHFCERRTRLRPRL